MARLIKKVNDGSIIEYDSGKFDDWCVYLTRNGESRYAPKDTEYFRILGNLGNRYGHQRLYNDFVKIYKTTNSRIDDRILKHITDIASEYGEHASEIDIWFTVIYAGMVAEENKKNAILKKRIKRLGMYQILIEGKAPDYAANFSRGRKWRELDSIMQKLGF
jgi:hypothetical protein